MDRLWSGSTPTCMQVLPLTEDMRYYSDYHKACVDLETGLPGKSHLEP